MILLPTVPNYPRGCLALHVRRPVPVKYAEYLRDLRDLSAGTPRSFVMLPRDLVARCARRGHTLRLCSLGLLA